MAESKRNPEPRGPSSSLYNSLCLSGWRSNLLWGQMMDSGSFTCPSPSYLLYRTAVTPASQGIARVKQKSTGRSTRHRGAAGSLAPLRVFPTHAGHHMRLNGSSSLGGSAGLSTGENASAVGVPRLPQL